MATGELRTISFPFRKGSNGIPQPVKGARAVVEDLQALLLIEAGEIPMEPSLGGRFHGFVFESSGPILQARVAQELRTIIRSREPRAQVLAVTTETIEDGPAVTTRAVVDLQVAGEQVRMYVPLAGS